jgi:hypothetical protein
MLVNFVNEQTGLPVSINPTQITCVFVAKVALSEESEETVEKTVIGLPGGTVVVTEGYSEVVGRIQGELK